MTYTFIALHMFLLGYVLCLVLGQGPTNSSEAGAISPTNHVGAENVHGREDNESDEDEGDEEDDSAFTRLQNVTNFGDFLSLLKMINGNPVAWNDVFSNSTDEDKLTINSEGGRMAVPDDCSPRDTTVRLNFTNSNPNVVYFPRCTKIERCGGCCPSPHLECVPSYIERVSLRVIKAEVPEPGSSHLEWKGEFASVIVDRHINCRVQCTLTPSKCGPKREFRERQCECKCRTYERCQPPHVWDPEECECKCAEVQTCCENGEQCPLTFLKETCECGVDNGKQVITGEVAGNNSSISEALNSNSNNNNITDIIASSSSTATETTATSTTTTTTTNPPPATHDPCPGVHCPPNFAKQLDSSGNCRCRPVFARRRPGPSP